MSVPDLSITLINHSNPELLRQCLLSIFQSVNGICIEVIVVDNATDKKLVTDMQREFPKVIWMFNEFRLGYSANHNKALLRAGGRYLCTLNDDTLVHFGALEEIVSYFDDNPDVGMIGPKLLNADGTIQNSVYYFPTFLSLIITGISLPQKFVTLKKSGFHVGQSSVEPVVVDWILGACQIIRRDVYEKIGGLDDKMSPIVYSEDMEWARRCHAAGFKVVFLPNAQVTHFGGQSTKTNSTNNLVYENSFIGELWSTRVRYLKKYNSIIYVIMFKIVFCFVVMWNILMHTQSFCRMKYSSIIYKLLLRQEFTIINGVLKA